MFRKLTTTILKILLICFLLFSVYPVNAQTWHKLGNGVGQRPLGYVQCLKVINNDLYVGGNFTTDYGAPCNGITKFNGIKWDSLSCGINGIINNIDCFSDDKIYITGNFTEICGDNSFYHIAKWNGISWEPFIGDVPNGEINSMIFKDQLYFGGNFYTIGSTVVNRIASWNGSLWNGLGGGVTSPLPHEVRAMAIYNGELIVAGSFYKAGNDTVNNIAAWDGNQWKALGKGVNDLVWTLYTDTIDNLLYVGGNFTMADTISVKYIAYWNGQKWNSLKDTTNSFQGIAGVFAISRFNNKIFAGGAPKSNPPSLQDTILASWDGNKWTKINGPNGVVNALTVYKGNLYVGGGFTKINNDVSIKCIACYGDSCPVNVGINENLLNITEYLWQNVPNPFKNTTTIQYYLPFGSEGSIEISDISVKGLMKYPLQQGKNNLDISLLLFNSGTYLYSIRIDGTIRETKKMILE